MGIGGKIMRILILSLFITTGFSYKALATEASQIDKCAELSAIITDLSADIFVYEVEKGIEVAPPCSGGSVISLIANDYCGMHANLRVLTQQYIEQCAAKSDDT